MGAGHDGAAQEICTRLEQRGYVTKIVDFLDASPRAGRFLHRTYHFQMEKSPWSYGAMYWAWSRFKTLSKLTTFALGALFEQGLRSWAEDFNADAVITTYPFASVVLGRARRKRRNPLRVPAFTFLTDFAVHPLWVHEGIDAHICVSPSAASGVRHLLRSPKISISGPFVPERFFRDHDRTALRASFGIPEGKLAVLLSAGSWGVGDIAHTYQQLAAVPEIFPILICGRNEALRQRVEAHPGGLALGWTDKMAELLAASDVVIQNAGGLTALEAFASGVPVVSYKPIAGHGRDNTRRMQLSGVTLFARDRHELINVVRQAVERSSSLTSAALGLFDANPETHFIEAFEAASPVPPVERLPLQPSKIIARTAIAAGAFFIGTNVVANVVGNQGLNVEGTSARLPYVYLAVLPSTSALASASFRHTLRANDIAAVISYGLARAQPNEVKALASSGVTIANGGSTTDGDIHLLLPQNAISGPTTYLDALTGQKVHLYLPQVQVNSLDLAWAAIHHELIPKVRIATSFNHLPITNGTTVYEINGAQMSTKKLLATISATINKVEVDGYIVAPVTTLGTP
jgi:UDP-N-acetylglucosamine:LPS N-acetylglucosamine transferase